MHYEVTTARFPHFIDLFIYDNSGLISGINKKFTWNNYTCDDSVAYILDLAKFGEWENIGKITNAKEFVKRTVIIY
jgi:hypothetical protein